MNKQYFLLSAALLLTGAAKAQQGTELFFSEYDEGAHQNGVNYGGATNSTGNERALEIYNPTNDVVNLTPYSVRRYSNGSLTTVDEERLMRTTGANILNARGVYVYANGEASLSSIRSVASQFGAFPYDAIGPNYINGGGATKGNVTYFNGDDAVALVRYPSGTAGQGPGVIVDLIGCIGEAPQLAAGGAGGNWSGFNPIDDTSAPVVHTYVASANQSLVRRPTVSGGIRTNPGPQNVPNITPPVRSTAANAYNIADEWSVYSYAFPPGTSGNGSVGAQLYDQLGNHNDYIGAHGAYQTTITATLGKFDANISVYPNPAHGTATVEIKDAKVGLVNVRNSLGQNISAQAKGQGQEKLTLDVSRLKPGLYFVEIYSADGQTKIYKTLMVQ
ncbi:T9SS type A sorting domain-containing protein [Hymenobacter negativus]|uniref:T9SS type A sorting domain-containing protein n=1 Tax=Hymenobacter negativus TaxID=2795026 RepID=A0ABS3QCQ3_9BACT|nr:T9SS type A sorting domain-containing protein [Hymenobacter negativus]MBO2009013.1 T9SS type A sorting domain-containing protein [Hymenobacter negativus]